MLAKGNELFITEADDASTINSAKIFMDNLSAMIESYDLEQQIADQENRRFVNRRSLIRVHALTASSTAFCT